MTHLYLQPRFEDFVRWSGHQPGVQHEDGITRPGDPASDLPLLPEPYSKSEVLEYYDFCLGSIDDWVGALDFSSPASGFDWHPIPKLEHQLMNLRHVQHHTAQLIVRLRNRAGLGVGWVRSQPEAPGG